MPWNFVIIIRLPVVLFLLEKLVNYIWCKWFSSKWMDIAKVGLWTGIPYWAWCNCMAYCNHSGGGWARGILHPIGISHPCDIIYFFNELIINLSFQLALSLLATLVVSIVKLFHKLHCHLLFSINSWIFQLTGYSKGLRLSISCSYFHSVTIICAWIVFWGDLWRLSSREAIALNLSSFCLICLVCHS